MAAEATTAVHGWPSYHASNLLGPRRMIQGRTRGYLKNTKHTNAMERLRDKSGYDHDESHTAKPLRWQLVAKPPPPTGPGGGKPSQLPIGNLAGFLLGGSYK